LKLFKENFGFLGDGHSFSVKSFRFSQNFVKISLKKPQIRGNIPKKLPTTQNFATF
jgi:hypothetical protein